MRAAPWSEPIREAEELLLVDRIQQRGRRPLDDFVLESSHGCVELHLGPANLWDLRR